jgi:hypothetical protein
MIIETLSGWLRVVLQEEGGEEEDLQQNRFHHVCDSNVTKKGRWFDACRSGTAACIRECSSWLLSHDVYLVKPVCNYGAW